MKSNGTKIPAPSRQPPGPDVNIIAALLIKLVLVLVFCLADRAAAQWVAFNDHAAGSGTHLNATRYDVFGNGLPSGGQLKNVSTGALLPAYLTITRSPSGVAGAQAAGNPAPGTLLAMAFAGYVDFAGSPSNSVELTGSGVVTYSFTGLNPDKRYSFKGAAVRGDPGYTNRWTVCHLTGAVNFTPAHSSTRVLTSMQVPEVAVNAAALNTGVNHTAATGDYVGWDDIVPAGDGSFAVACRQYIGTVPGGSSSGSKGYGLTGIRLEESPCSSPMALSLASSPQNQAAIAGGTVNFEVAVAGCPATYQWYKDGNPISGANSSNFRINTAQTNHTGNYFVVVTNQISAVTSAIVRLSVYPDLSVPLVPLSHSWRYEQTGADLGTAWKENAYGDTNWLTGLGVFAMEENPAVQPFIRTVLSLSGTNGQRIITYYFRTHFRITNNAANQALLCSNLVDDGAVVWLNGTELYRLNLESGPITASTLASNASEGVFEAVSLMPTNLLDGDNVLAVEVHQASASSGDVVFGLALTAVPLDSGPVVVRGQPENLTVISGEPANFQVDATGQAPLTYQWRLNGIDLPGETNAVLALSNASIEHDGFYAVRVTNPFGAVRSLPARLHVNTPGWTPFYGASFEEGAGPEWSSSQTEVSPIGARHFLGQFSDGSVTLSLNSLPVHSTVTVAFDLFLIRSWDGNASGYIGPDEWKLDVPGGPVLLRSTFSNWRTQTVRREQCFPDWAGGDTNPPYTGAEEENSLGYYHSDEPMDAVYRLTGTFAHTGSALALRFSGVNLQGVVDEGWGLDNVKVYLGGHSGDGWPMVLTQPSSQTVAEGEDLKFTVSAAGAAPLRYQWFCNSMPVLNATNSILILRSVGLPQGGQYAVRVSNSYASILSDSAELIVLEPFQFGPPALSNGWFTARLLGLDHRNPVVLETSTNLLVGSWTPVLTNNTGAYLDFMRSTSNGAVHFYRAVTR